MAQEYEVIAFEPTDFKDNNNNYWCNAAFLGVSEPVKWVVKDPMKFKVGDKVYGELKDMTSKAGKPYLRFYRENRPDEAQQSFTPSPKKEWQPRDDMAIRAQWAIGQAVQLAVPHLAPATPIDVIAINIEKTAKELFAMIDRVKGSSESADPKPLNSPGVQTATTTISSGYEKAKAIHQQIKAKQDVPENDAEMQSLIGSAVGAHIDQGTDINLDDIPF